MQGIFNGILATQVYQNENDVSALLDKLDSIIERLHNLKVVMDTGALVGEIIGTIDMALGEMQMLSERGV